MYDMYRKIITFLKHLSCFKFRSMPNLGRSGLVKVFVRLQYFLGKYNYIQIFEFSRYIYIAAYAKLW